MKIKLVHLLFDPNYSANIPEMSWLSNIDKQNQSITAFDKIKYHFNSYTQVYSKVNRTELPIDTCAYPEIVVEDNTDINRPHLSYGHYGAYKAHKEAILNEFDESLDAIIIIESDVIPLIDDESFVKSIYDGVEFAKNNDASFITFGELKLGARRPNPLDELIHYENYIKTPHFLCCHCYAILSKERENIKNLLNERKWHAFDIWLFWNYDTRVPMYASKHPLVSEPSGFSTIENKYRN